MSTPVGKSRKPKTEPQKKPRSTLFRIGALALTVVAAAIWLGGKAITVPEAPSPSVVKKEAAPAQTQKGPEPPATDAGEAPLFSESLLTAGQAPAPVEAKVIEEDPALDIPFKLEQVALALSHIEIDEDGGIVINENAQTILEQAFLDAGPQMDEQQLAQLKTLIEAGLEGPAGAQAVDIAEKFYRYSNAFKEISDTLAMRADPASLQKDYEQISRLRRAHLGPELAEQLYAREEKLTRYTLDVMEIQSDPSLTPEQREEKRQALVKKYPQLMASDSGTEDDGDNASPARATN